MPLVPSETIPVDSAFRAVCFPHAGRPVVPEHQLPTRRAYNAQFHVWCAGKNGTVTIRDARDAEAGAGTAERAASTPVARLDVLHTLAFPQSFPKCIIAVPTQAAGGGEGEVWIGYVDGLVRVFQEQHPFALLAEIGHSTNKAPCNALAVDAGDSGCTRTVVGAFGDEHVLVFDAELKVVHAKLLGHTAAVNGVAFLGGSHIFATAGDDGRLCVWDLAVDAEAPVATFDGEHPHALTSCVSVTLAESHASQLLRQHASDGGPHREFQAAGNTDDQWCAVVVAGASGHVLVFVAPYPRFIALDEPAMDVRPFFRAPLKKVNRSAAVTALTVGPPTLSGAPTILGATAGATKIFRYDTATLQSLPPLSPALADGAIGVGCGSYPPCGVSTATLLPTWSIDASGRLTPFTLERTGAAGSMDEQLARAAIRRAAFERAAVATVDAVTKHQALLTAIQKPREDPDVAAAAAETAALVAQYKHLRTASADVAKRRSDAALLARYLSNWKERFHGQKHAALRRAALQLFGAISNEQRRAAMRQWAHGATILKLHRSKIEAAQRLLRISDRRLLANAFHRLIAFRAERTVGRRLKALVDGTATAVRARALSSWRAFARLCKARQAQMKLAEVLRRQVSDGLRVAYFDRWRRLPAEADVKAELRRAADRCLSTLASSSDRGLRALYFGKLRRFPAVKRNAKARLGAAQFLVGNSTALLRERSFARWRIFARNAALRRATGSGNAALIRLTDAGMRRAYFNKWRASLAVRKAAEQRGATADGALWFIASRNDTATRDLYFAKWRRFAAARGVVRRQATAADAFLRQTRIGRSLAAFRVWRRWIDTKRASRARARTADALLRGTAQGLTRVAFDRWRQLPQQRREVRRRNAVLQTMGRSSTGYLRAVYFKRWLAVRNFTVHFREASQFMQNQGLNRLKMLRTIYLGKWQRFAAGRICARFRERRNRATALQQALLETESQLQALKQRLDDGRGDMVNMQAEDATAREQTAEIAREIEKIQEQRAAAEARLDKRQVRIAETTEKVKQYVFTLVNPMRRRPVDVAAGWKEAWLALETQLVALGRDARSGGAMPFAECHAALTGARDQLLTLRSRVSIDVAEHLSIKKERPASTAPSPVRSRVGTSTTTMTPRSPAPQRPPSPARVSLPASRAATPRLSTRASAAATPRGTSAAVPTRPTAVPAAA